MKHSMIICIFERRLTNPITLAIATLRSFKVSLRSGEKCWLPSNVWNLLKVLLPHTVLIHYSSMSKHPSKSDYSRKKPQRIGLNTWNWLQVEVIACGISWSELEKEGNLQELSTKKSHSLGIFFFGLGVFKGCNTLMEAHLLWPSSFPEFPRET